MNHFIRRWLVRSFAGILLVNSGTPAARAQAWTSAPGTGSISLSYQVTKVRNHLFGGPINQLGVNKGRSRDLGRLTGQGADLVVNYVLAPNFAVNGSVAWVGATYVGTRAENPTLDDGKFHGTFQDASFGANYTFPLAGLAISPNVDYVFPTHAYDHHGHAAPGSHHTSVALGTVVARSLAPWLPNSYMQIDYAHRFTTNIDRWGLDSNRYAVEAGFFALPALLVQGHFSYFGVIDGIDWNVDKLRDPTIEHMHDAAAKTLVRRAGGALRYQFNSTRSLFIDISGVVSGENTHDGVSYAAGTSWNFVTRFAH